MDGAELNAALRRQAGVALDHAVLYLHCAAHGVDHAPEFDEAAVAGALDVAAMMRAIAGSIKSLRRPRSRDSVRSSSANRLEPTTSATRIAASFRVSLMERPFAATEISTKARREPLQFEI
jgi:hypothetical protein